jgi:hypothetical protein
MATVLGLCSELLRIQLLQLQRQSSTLTADCLEIYLMSVVSALKNQLKSEMYTEAQLIAERSDELLY